MTATLAPQLSSRSQIARASAALASPCNVRDVVSPVLSRTDLALYLYNAVPQYELFIGDTLLCNKTIEPQAGDKVVLLFRGGHTDVVSFDDYTVAPKADIHMVAVVLGFIRSMGEA